VALGIATVALPLLALDAGYSKSAVGLLTVVSAVSQIGARTLVRALTISMLGAGAGVALVALFAGSAPLAALVPAASGLGAGALQTLGPALASDMVHPQERGDAIPATCTFRASALFASPLAVAGLLSRIALGPAMPTAGLDPKASRPAAGGVRPAARCAAPGRRGDAPARPAGDRRVPSHAGCSGHPSGTVTIFSRGDRI
jgi:MFS family permease